MNKLKKPGRLAFLLPYLIMPVYAMLIEHEDLQNAVLISYFLPFGIESPIIVLFPVCWIISLICFIACAKENKRNNDKKGKTVNRLLLLFTVIWTGVHIAAIIVFLRNFKLTF